MGIRKKGKKLTTDSKGTLDLGGLQQTLREFAKARDWEQFHTPKNLAMALSVEAAELLEIFQWTTAEESHTIMATKGEDVRDELADIVVYCVRLADQLKVDLPSAIAAKMKKNAAKYPPELARGSSKKYTELGDN
mgnify:FL=1